MALILQDDTGLIADANSYASYAEFLAYWLARGVDYSDRTEDEVNASLVKALDYTDLAFIYNGKRLNGRDQTTQFPREELYDNECNLVETIPIEIKYAQIEYAKRELAGSSLYSDANEDGAIKSQTNKIDVISETVEYYDSGQAGDNVSYPSADNKIPESFIAYIANSNWPHF